MRILFLDDERNPEDVTWVNYPANAEFTVVRNFEQFMKAVKNSEVFDAFSLDHDIQEFKFGREFTGYTCLLEVMTNCLTALPPCVVAHSKNPIGAKKITDLYTSYKGKQYDEYARPSIYSRD